ncbi:hypothetical protein [Cellvibrio mixtus]|uniref:hypothetical protein n=1 Tax=Cellvibrio mixtus TaxID=39650 RepID=UPI000587E83E|nr:hypothetical protein [Cellvibrio mixtus]
MSERTGFTPAMQYLRVILTAVFVIFSCNAAAVVIDFDDIDVYHDPDGGCFCDNPITDQYRDKGLLVDSGYLSGEKRPDGTNDNQLLGSLSLTLFFVDNFPNRVSFFVDAVYDQAVFIDAVGLNGWNESKKTDGYGGPFEENTPYIPHQLVSFYSPEGITSISLSTFYNLRVSTSVDNLSYDYSLPEPPVLLLVLTGFLVLLSSRKRWDK